VLPYVGFLFRCYSTPWNDSFRDATRHFWCRQCAARIGRRVQPMRLETVAWEKGVIELEMPDDREWKRAMRRFRT